MLLLAVIRVTMMFKKRGENVSNIEKKKNVPGDRFYIAYIMCK